MWKLFEDTNHGLQTVAVVVALAGFLSIFETANKLWEWKQATHTHTVEPSVSVLLSIELLKYFVIFLNHHKFELVLPRHLAVGHQRDKNFPNVGNINKLEMLNSALFSWASAKGQAVGPRWGSALPSQKTKKLIVCVLRQQNSEFLCVFSVRQLP